MYGATPGYESVGDPRLIAKTINFEGSGWHCPWSWRFARTAGAAAARATDHCATADCRAEPHHKLKGGKP